MFWSDTPLMSKYRVILYEDSRGRSPVGEYIQDLKESHGKDARLNFNKIIALIDKLEEQGVYIGEPYTKKLTNEIWELRPLRNRILYASYQDGVFILLHAFVKKTQKTPSKEIDTAKRRLRDYQERNNNGLERI